VRPAAATIQPRRSTKIVHNPGYNLAIVYLIWLGIVIALYPACRWFADVKQRNRSVVLSYL